MNSPHITEIIEETIENNDIKTFFFKHSEVIKPGQFFMVWIPGIDEIPMSVSFIDKNIRGITFKRVGRATKALFNLSIKDKIGIRGPYGNGFKINDNKILFIGGGTGIATLITAIEESVKKDIISSVIIGVKSSNELLFEKRLRKCGVKIFICTDDGSKGFHGYASNLAEKILHEYKFKSILTCGPEIMMKKIFNICGSIKFQASLERYMKCGVGICSQCCIGDGLRVCVEGPVFDNIALKKLIDFGNYKRDSSGKKIYF